jgi:hypothetical protein
MRHWRESAFIRWTCLFLGLAVVLGALAQLGAFVVVGYLGALFHDGSVADGSLGRNATPVGGLDFVFRLGPAWQLLLLAPIIAGLGGLLVYWPQRRLIGKAVVGLSTAAALVGAIVVQSEGYGIFGPQLILSLWSGTILLPFCVALFVIAMLVKKDRAVQMTPLT